MENSSVQSIEEAVNVDQGEVPAEGTSPKSPLKKFLPLIIILAVVLLIGSLALVLVAGKSRNKEVPVSANPTTRPTATPFGGQTSTKLSITPTKTSTTSAKIGRLAFIKDGDIYHSDLFGLSLLVKNATPAADKLTWSTNGNYLAWRPKITTASPAALTLYDKKKDLVFSIEPSTNLNTEIIDYAWTAREDQVAILFHDTSYKISIFSVKSASTIVTNKLIRDLPINQIIWPNDNTIIFSGNDGIKRIDIGSTTTSDLITNSAVVYMKLSPNKDKILYSVGDDKKSDLYIVNTDGTGNTQIPSQPAKIDMGTTNLSSETLNGGFITYAIWFPKGDIFLVGYHYLTNLPLVGVYDLKAGSFSAISPFALLQDDFMVDELRLLGARSKAGLDSQVSLYTIEEGAKLATQRVFTGASSPTFFPGNL